MNSSCVNIKDNREVPDVLSYKEYYPFGMLVPNRSASSAAYRYGFNGMEKDDELKGITGSSYDFGARMYDPRVGRWFSLDPQSKKNSFESNYNYVSGNPIIYTDPDGETKRRVTVINDERTGKTIVIHSVINDDITYKTRNRGSKALGLETHSSSFDYTWHDISVVQNITIDKDGNISASKPVEMVNPEIMTSTFEKGNWSKGVAKKKMAYNAFSLMGDGDSWNGGGIDFYSKKGEGSGIKVKNKHNVLYLDGDEAIAGIKSLKNFGGSKVDKKMLNKVYGAILDGKLGKPTEFFRLAKDIKKVLKVFQIAKETTEEIYKQTNEAIKPKKVWNGSTSGSEHFLNKRKDSFMTGEGWFPMPDDSKLDGGGGGNQGTIELPTLNPKN